MMGKKIMMYVKKLPGAFNSLLFKEESPASCTILLGNEDRVEDRLHGLGNDENKNGK